VTRGPSILRPGGDRSEIVPGARILGIGVFLASISMLFLAVIVAYVVVRHKAPNWPPLDAPALPKVLWLSTLSLIGVSVFLHRALATVRRGVAKALMPQVGFAAFFATIFLLSQGAAWLYFMQNDTTFERHLFAFTFYMLTGLHGLHILGGMIGFVVLFVRVWQGEFSWANTGSLRYHAIYWDYLLVVWVVLYGILLLDR